MSEPATTVLLYLILSATSGGEITPDALAAELASRDVVFLGEEHDNAAGHQAQLEIVKALHSRRHDLVISMEMFERDVQGALDDYLRGRIDEATFLKNARPWNNYKDHYRPIVELAKELGLDVIAANAPRDAARRASVRGLSAAAEAGVARRTSAPEDRYFELFKVAMKDHVGSSGDEALKKMYTAQCLKDDTMAESIADYLAQHRHRRPLVVHLCGKFHSEYGLGTVSRLLERRPLTSLGVLTMAAAEDPMKVSLPEHADKAHYILAVKAEPKKEEPKPEVKAEAHSTEAKPPVETQQPTPAQGKAAMGIMPDYGASDAAGVAISGVSSGGAAEKAGLKSGDRILKLGKSSVLDLEDYMSLLADYKPGDVIDVVILRDGKEVTLKVTLQLSQRN